MRLPLIFRQLVDALGSVVVAVIEEVAGDKEPRFVRDWALAGRCRARDWAGEEPIEPGVDDCVGRSLVAIPPQTKVADLGSAEAAAGQVDRNLRQLKRKAVVVGERRRRACAGGESRPGRGRSAFAARRCRFFWHRRTPAAPWQWCEAGSASPAGFLVWAVVKS